MNNFEIYNIENNDIKIERDKRWPLVYILKNNNEMYIGETTSILKRIFDHSKNPKKSNLNEKIIIKHNKSNKSSSYLMESDLINRAFADDSWRIINRKKQSNEVLNGHDFFGKEDFKKDLESIWNELVEYGLFKKKYSEIENEELFKYSPWKEFDSNQLDIISKVTDHISLMENSFIEGGAGTGKTLLIIRIAMDHVLSGNHNIRAGIYTAKKGNHKTFKRVISKLDPIFKNNIEVLENLNEESIGKVDYLLIDEAQRLRKSFKFSAPKYFINDWAVDEVDWLEKNGVKYSLFYDLNQAFHKNDNNLIKYISDDNKYLLLSQFRMQAGDQYISFIKEILQINKESDNIYNFNDYEFKVYDDLEKLFKRVVAMNKSIGNLDNKSRMLSSLNINNGDWITMNEFNNLDKAKNIDYSNIKTEFTFGEYKAVWNKKAYYNDWLEKSDISEVGCVHTAQGRDFKYAGIIFGNDIKFNNGKIIATDEVKNIYFILLTRGIWGHGIYIEDQSLKEYFVGFINRKIK